MKVETSEVVEVLNFLLGCDLQPEICFKTPEEDSTLVGPSPLHSVCGYFRRPNKIIINGNTKDWFPVLIHEYCHMYSYSVGNVSLHEYQKACAAVGWAYRAEERLAVLLTRALRPLVMRCIRNPNKRAQIRKRWNKIRTSIAGQLRRLASSVIEH